MSSNLHQLLRSLCLSSDWKYAIFWKLRHRSRMVLTWEDAYYDNPDYDSSESKCCQKALEHIGGGDFSHDPLGLAVAKMSYHVYSLGEGIVGQVAITGKHHWICEDDQVTSSDPSFKFADVWQSQFSAGIRNLCMNNNSVNDLICPSEKVRVGPASFPSNFWNSVSCESDKLHYVDFNQKGVLNVSIPSDANSQKDIEKSNVQTKPCFGNTTSTMKFPAGYELHEALGPGFLKGSKYFDQAAQENQDVKPTEMSDEISCSQLTSESYKEHLLGAMVTNVCYNNNYIISELSFSTSMQAAMASARNPEDSIHTVHTINSEGYSIDHPSHVREEKQHGFSSSGISDLVSPKKFLLHVLVHVVNSLRGLLNQLRKARKGLGLGKLVGLGRGIDN